ncbi:MAG: heavy-metal-associated domain-containing protein [Bacilli bacterium]|nr:heavy-metal-associated domain-containing protein [Bacilli bacterium]
MNKIVINIEGMHCESCKSRVEKALLKENEIISAKVNLKEKNAEIEYENLTKKDIKNIIETLGFKVK